MAVDVREGIDLETLHPELIERLELSTSLTHNEVTRIVGDVLDYFNEETVDLVRRRHRELAAKGWTNDAIFPRLGRESSLHRVAMPNLSLRQLRRMVYG